MIAKSVLIFCAAIAAAAPATAQVNTAPNAVDDSLSIYYGQDGTPADATRLILTSENNPPTDIIRLNDGRYVTFWADSWDRLGMFGQVLDAGLAPATLLQTNATEYERNPRAIPTRTGGFALTSRWSRVYLYDSELNRIADAEVPATRGSLAQNADGVIAVANSGPTAGGNGILVNLYQPDSLVLDQTVEVNSIASARPIARTSGLWPTVTSLSRGT